MAAVAAVNTLRMVALSFEHARAAGKSPSLAMDKRLLQYTDTLIKEMERGAMTTLDRMKTPVPEEFTTAKLQNLWRHLHRKRNSPKP